MVDIINITDELDTIGLTQSYNCDPEQSKMFLHHTNKSVNILHVNIRSVNRNFDELVAFLKRTCTQPDVVVLSECWLNRTPVVPLLEGYESYKTSHNKNQNDGVVIYVKSLIKHTVAEASLSEATCLICKMGVASLAILGIYRSPSKRINVDFLNELDETIRSLFKYKNIVLIGDTNIDIVPTYLTPQANEYLNLMASHGLIPTHWLPTRELKCIDHIFLKSTLNSVTLVFDTHFTDHKPILLNVETSNKPEKRKNTYVKVDYAAVFAEVSSTDMSVVRSILNPDVATEMLVSIIRGIILKHSVTKHTPSKYVIKKPWITRGLLRCIRNRDSMYKRVKNEPENYTLKVTYLRYRNFCNKLLRRLKHEYEKHEFQKAKNDARATWKVIRTVTQENCHKRSAAELLTDDGKVTIDEINRYFSTVGGDLARRIASGTSGDASLSGEVNIVNTMVLLPTDESEVDNIIRSLRKTAAVGWDGISTQLLQECSYTLVPIITHICNISMSKGIFPKLLKIAIVHPIFKSGSRDSVNNYRPISVLPALSKILEKLLNTRLKNFLEKNKVLSTNQFGFRGGKSTEDAVASLVGKVVNCLDNRLKPIGIFLDLTKAFDTVSVPQLLMKMENMGIRGYALGIFSDYLTNRNQCVKINSFISSNAPLVCGVPQGSVLGPTLFLLYINSLCNLRIPDCSIFSYADDTALLVSGGSWSEAFSRAEQALARVMKWLTANLLTLNVNKTTYLTFSLNASGQPSAHTFNLKAHTCPQSASPTSCDCLDLTKSTEIKYLGVYIDNLMTWKPHITWLTSRVRKIIYAFKMLRHSAERDTLKMVYFALCQSILAYCISIWGGAAKTHMLPLERAQRAVLKVMTFKPYRYSTQQLYDDCQLLTVRKLFLQEAIIRKHTGLEYNSTYTQKRRSDKVCPLQNYRSALAARHQKIISSLYNKINKECNIYHMSKTECKKKVSNWLMSKTYDDIENLVRLSCG